MEKSFDIGVLGWWYGENYGSMLTYYALNKVLKKLGYSVLMIHEALGYNGWRVAWNDNIAPLEFARRVGYDYTEQVHFSELGKFNEKCHSFLVGSDQLWNPLIGRVNNDLFLDFVDNDKVRISYGTSFGNRNIDKFKADFISKHRLNLKNFAAISVRENYAIDIAKDVFEVDATQVVDPVFLLSEEDYSELAEKATFKMEGKYLLAFILDPNEGKRLAISAVANKLGYDKIVILANPEHRESAEEIFRGVRYEIVEGNKPENWLYSYKNAEYVITDSFHGCCFAYIFKKPFSSFFNQVRGADRFVNLMSLFGFGDSRRIYESDREREILDNVNVIQELDFNNAIQNVGRQAMISLDWLESTLKNEGIGKSAMKD